MGTKKTKEQNLELKYSGSLLDSEALYLHYGFGDSWADVSETKMRKLKSGYKVEVPLNCGDKIKFCFRDTNGNWDNNYGNDYVYEIGEESQYPHIEIKLSSSETTKKATKKKA